MKDKVYITLHSGNRELYHLGEFRKSKTKKSGYIATYCQGQPVCVLDTTSFERPYNRRLCKCCKRKFIGEFGEDALFLESL